VAKGIEIMEALRGHTSGFAIPTYVIDAPEGGGKVPILPNYLLSMSDKQVVVRNYEGFTSSYAQPVDYQSHDSTKCAYCLAHRDDGVQEGVAGLLEGHARVIAPEGWGASHQRNGVLASPPEVATLAGGNGASHSSLKRDEGELLTILRGGGQEQNRLSHTLTEEGLRVALIYNLKYHVEAEQDAPPDALAEYDSPETVQALEDALSSKGYEVIRLEADETLLDTIRQVAPDICFNIAEGLRGDARESQVPALLEMLGIPYTGSGVLTHALSLDKAMTKRIWRDMGLPTAPFQVMRRGNEPLDHQLTFPLFVKPLHEGTGMGINGNSIVYDKAALQEQASWVVQTYRQPALVEGFLPGREFTVGLIGNTKSPGERRWNGIYNKQGFHLFPVLEIDANVGAGAGLYNADSKSYNPGEEGAPLYFCPADIPASLEMEMKRLAVAAFEAIGSLDLGRVDFRLGSDGRPYLLEINTLPGLNPIVSDLCIMAQAEGMSYPDLINEILRLAKSRYEIGHKRKVNRYVLQGVSLGSWETVSVGGV